jgi:hypothetical protein
LGTRPDQMSVTKVDRVVLARSYFEQPAKLEDDNSKRGQPSRITIGIYSIME